MNPISYFGVDVDDKSFHVTGILEGGQQVQFNSRPNAASLATKLSNFKADGEIKVCYEAGYLGFSLFRELKAHNINVEVISPSSLPKSADHPIKNDRLDSERLAQFYKLNLLTVVTPPNETDEIIRDLSRSRQFLLKQQNALRLHVIAIGRRQGWSFRQETTLKTTWTTSHLKWLNEKISSAVDGDLKFNLSQLLCTLQMLSTQIESYSARIRSLSDLPKYRPSVAALSCYRGIDNLSAMVLITEIGDIKRFSKPRALMSYIGLDVREYSSGGRQKQYGITKLGNKYVRKTLVESVQSCNKRPRISWKLKKRRELAKPEDVGVANKCMNRLFKKSTRMILAGKNTNKVKIACARELTGFIWSSLHKVANRSEEFGKKEYPVS